VTLIPSAYRVGFLLGLLFNPQNGGNIFFRNIILSDLHGVHTQKIIIFTVIAIRSSKSRGLNLAVAKLATVQVIKLPL
jgi:hypothetical protein